MQPLDSALNYNMVSGVTGNHGKFNFGKKDELFIVPVGRRFCLCWRRGRIIDFQSLEIESRFITTNFLNFTWIAELFIAWMNLYQSFGNRWSYCLSILQCVAASFMRYNSVTALVRLLMYTSCYILILKKILFILTSLRRSNLHDCVFQRATFKCPFPGLSLISFSIL